jgi:peptidoglycan/LPS O-acetylase OafA/YrhL
LIASKFSIGDHREGMREIDRVRGVANQNSHIYLVFAFWICVAPPRIGACLIIATLVLSIIVGQILTFGTPPNPYDPISIFGANFFANPISLYFCAGIVLAMFVRIGKPRSWNWSLLILGDASYSIYLTHPFLILTMAWFWKVSGTGSDLPTYVWGVLMVAMAVVVGVVTFYLIERPMTRWLQARFSPKRAVSIASA